MTMTEEVRPPLPPLPVLTLEDALVLLARDVSKEGLSGMLLMNEAEGVVLARRRQIIKEHLGIRCTCCGKYHP